MEWLLVALGLIILVLAGDFLVKGAANIAVHLGIPPIIIGLTVVAFGTSAPELLVSVNAALTGAGGLAIGNVVGSNIANILLVLGLPALIAPMDTSECSSRRSFRQMIAATALFIAFAMTGQFNWMHGLALLAGLAIVLGMQFREVLAHRELLGKRDELPEEADPSQPMWKTTIYLVAGIAGLPLGADLLVDNAVLIAQDFGISDTVIGLTLVAIGTSLPELSTTVMAALRRETAVGLGNVIGSNIFNLLFIIGAASLVAPLPVDEDVLEFDLWVMLGTSLLLIPFVFMNVTFTRFWGLAMVLAYGVYLTLVIA